MVFQCGRNAPDTWSRRAVSYSAPYEKASGQTYRSGHHSHMGALSNHAGIGLSFVAPTHVERYRSGRQAPRWK
jgi:hypothetical protein